MSEPAASNTECRSLRPRLQGREPAPVIRQPGAALVEEDQPERVGEAQVKVAPARIPPDVAEVRHVVGHVHQVERPAADDLIRNRDATAPGIPRLRLHDVSVSQIPAPDTTAVVSHATIAAEVRPRPGTRKSETSTASSRPARGLSRLRVRRASRRQASAGAAPSTGATIDLDFGNISGSTVPDGSGNANDGTGKKGAVGSETSWSPTTTPDSQGNPAVVFDGTQKERIEIPNSRREPRCRSLLHPRAVHAEPVGGYRSRTPTL